MPLSGAPGHLVAHPLDLITFYPTRLSREEQENRVKETLENSSVKVLRLPPVTITCLTPIISQHHCYSDGRPLRIFLGCSW
jgi:hypothetical protein